MASAPKGTLFDDVAQIDAHAELIHKQAVTLKVMPPAEDMASAMGRGRSNGTGRALMAAASL